MFLLFCNNNYSCITYIFLDANGHPEKNGDNENNEAEGGEGGDAAKKKKKRRKPATITHPEQDNSRLRIHKHQNLKLY